jgi:HTH-type transcriptional repressor of NAD biosynthesis genes
MAVMKAFVFGKFLPFHKGHEAMMRFALTKCQQLTVLICCSNKETISGQTRKVWIDNNFTDETRLQTVILNYREEELPNTSASSQEVSALWAPVFKTYCADASLLITSEPYGEYVARYMNIQYLLFDAERKEVPVSASAITQDIFRNWQFLPDSVKPFYAKKVVVAGTESTGKTTLVQNLATHYKATPVFEAGRDIIPDSGNFNYNDLLLVAQEHAKRITNALTGNSPLIIIDTDIHITKSYAQFAFKKSLDVSDAIYNCNKAALRLYLDNSVAFVQDGTRLQEAERNLLDAYHRNTFAAHNINLIEITGSWQERFRQAVQHIDALIAPLKTNTQ